MSGRGIASMGLPPMRFRVDRGRNAKVGRFETLAASQDEDKLRARRLRKVALKYPAHVDGVLAVALATRLEKAGDGGVVSNSPASSVYMRGVRITVAGGVWGLIEEVGPQNVRAFTVIPRTWETSAADLATVSPVNLMNGLRVALYGQGAGQATGWIFAVLHGEWDPIGEVYRLHVHGFAYGEMVDVVDRLRGLPNYETQRFLKDGSPSPVYRRVRISRVGLMNLPAPVTYPLQSYWPEKALIISEDGTRIRARRKGRIKEPQHSHVLLWLDQWKIDDLSMMVGLRVTKAGLKQTKPVS